MTPTLRPRRRLGPGNVDSNAWREDTAHWTGRLIYAALRLFRLDDLHPYRRQLLIYRAAQLHAVLTGFLPVSLVTLFHRYGTDKEQVLGHSYGASYDRWLRPLRYQRIRMLEIGIGGYTSSFGGRSLLAWRAYFPFAIIVGCDLRSKLQLAGWGVKIRQVDQSSSEQLRRLAVAEGPFEVIIDDGSHANGHQILTFKTLFEHLLDGGIYVVEDTQTSYWSHEPDGPEVGGKNPEDPEFSTTCVGYFLRLANYLNHAEFLPDAVFDPEIKRFAEQVRAITFEHNLICVIKGRNDSQSNAIDSGLTRHSSTEQAAK